MGNLVNCKREPSHGDRPHETTYTGDRVGEDGMFKAHASPKKWQGANPPDSETIAGAAVERSNQKTRSADVKGAAW